MLGTKKEGGAICHPLKVKPEGQVRIEGTRTG